jgi:hypothetical protein
MTNLLGRDGYEERLAAWTVVFPDGGFPNVHAERIGAVADRTVMVNAEKGQAG